MLVLIENHVNSSHPQCSFVVHPICIRHAKSVCCSYVVERYVSLFSLTHSQSPCRKPQIVCLQHTSSFLSDRTTIYSSFPHVYEICFDACNLFLPSLLNVYSPEVRSTRPSSSSDTSLDPPRFNDRSYDIHSTETPRRSHQRFRRVGRPPHRARVDSMAKDMIKTETHNGPLNIRNIIQEIEDAYFSSRESAFWHFYKNVNCQPLFLDVPSYSTSSRHAYGGSKRGVIWDYQNDDVLLYTDALGITSWINRDNVRFVT